jgi:hypothetical protein
VLLCCSHVQAMMLRRHLEQLGVTELTEQEERLLTAGVRNTAAAAAEHMGAA